MSHPPIYLSDIKLDPHITLPFTHRLILVSNGWTHESHLELPDWELVIQPSATPRNYILGVQTLRGPDVTYVEPFDANLAHFAGAVQSLVTKLAPYTPIAAKHFLQGVANALIYFGRQYGYVTMDSEDGYVQTTTKRDH